MSTANALPAQRPASAEEINRLHAEVARLSAASREALNAAVKLNRTLDKKLPTAKLNQVLGYLAERNPPPAIGGKRFRTYYATQTGNRPFRIKIFCNREEKLTEQYRRYLEAGLVKEFGLDGCPIHFDLVGKKKRSIEDRLDSKSKTARQTGGGAPEEDFEAMDLMDD